MNTSRSTLMSAGIGSVVARSVRTVGSKSAGLNGRVFFASRWQLASNASALLVMD